MDAAFRVVLRSNGTEPPRETQETVLPAVAEAFGQRASVRAADLTPDDRLRAARIGTVDVDDADALCDVYERLEAVPLVEIDAMLTDGGASVVARDADDVDREAVRRRDDLDVVGSAHGDLLVRVRGDDA